MKISDKETLSIATTVSDVLEGKSKVQKMDPKKYDSKDKESGAFCVYNSAGKKVKEFESNEEAEKYAIDQLAAKAEKKQKNRAVYRDSFGFFVFGPRKKKKSDA